MSTPKDLAAGLRQLADWLDEWAESLPVPDTVDVLASAQDTREEVARLARLLAPCEKADLGDIFKLVKRFGPVSYAACFWRTTVCERRVVGTRHVEAQTIPAHEEEIVEWDCGRPILGGPDLAVAVVEGE